MSSALLLAGLIVAGCASPDANPPKARANTGYVDFYPETDGLLWDVSRFDARTGEYQRVFSQMKPPSDGFLRVALPPGRHRLRVTFLNQAIDEPADLEVAIPDGKIVPVRVTLLPGGTVETETKERNLGGTARGYYGRRTIVGSDEMVMYRIIATAAPPVVYRPKGQTPYVR